MNVSKQKSLLIMITFLQDQLSSPHNQAHAESN